MYLEAVILSVMSTRAGFKRLKHSVKLNQLAKVAQNVIKGLDGYYKTYNHDKICIDTFKLHLYSMQKDTIDKEELPVYNALIKKFNADVDEETIRGVVKQIKELDLATELASICQQYDQGDEIDVYEELRGRLSDYEHELRNSLDNIEVTDDIETIIQELESGLSFHWTHQALALAMPDMRTGDQVIFAARPGTGKTSFLVYEVARMAPDLPEDKCILWLCNEGKGSKIRVAKYRTLTGLTQNELIQLGGDACRKLVEDAGAGETRFRVFNIHGKNIYDLESIIQEVKPAIVVSDMLDNVKGFASEARTDLRLEEVYKWMRDCAVIYDFLSLATSQTSMDAEGLPFPTQDMLKDSKTGKAGACDAIIVMGKDNSPEKINSRFISIAKAWKGSPVKGEDPTARSEMLFDGERCLFGVPVIHSKQQHKERS